MATVQQVSKFLNEVTGEQIGRCHLAFADNGEHYYMVENESGKFDDDQELIEYKVTFDKKHGFRCTCGAGKVGFSNCKRGFCKHVLWSLATALEVRAAVKEQEAMQEEAAIAASEHKAECDSDDAQEAAIREFYAQESYRQSAQAAFMLALPSRQAANK